MCFIDCSTWALKHWKPSATFYIAFSAILKFTRMFVTAEQNFLSQTWNKGQSTLLWQCHDNDFYFKHLLEHLLSTL